MNVLTQYSDKGDNDDDSGNDSIAIVRNVTNDEEEAKENCDRDHVSE